jgi:alpha-tubulin suppressor-like RCC1 family protein
VERVLCGVQFSMILHNGKILSCGRNDGCQLGLGDNFSRPNFVKIELPDKVKLFHTFGNHSMVLLGRLISIYFFQKMERYINLDIMIKWSIRIWK